MTPKKIIIFSAILVIIVILAAGFFAYKKGYFSKSSSRNLKPEDLIVFEIKDQNLSLAAREVFQNRFEKTKEALQKNSDDFDSWLSLGLLKKWAGDYEGSRDVLIHIGKIRPANSSSFSSLADLYANFLNEPLKAEEAIKTAIANDPNDYNFYIALAEIYRYRIPGKEALYEETLLGALQKFPEEVNLISQLAVYYHQTNQVEKAIVYYEKVVKLNPDNQTAKQDLAELKQ